MAHKKQIDLDAYKKRCIFVDKTLYSLCCGSNDRCEICHTKITPNDNFCSKCHRMICKDHLNKVGENYVCDECEIL